MVTKEIVLDHLASHGIRPSMQRMLVMKYLMEHRTHPSVEDIYNDLSPEYPTLSKTTIYNTLKLLQQHGAILVLTIDEKHVRYDADISEHSHFRCTKCTRLFDFAQPIMTGEELGNGFIVESCHVYYRGICPQCQTK